MANPPKDNSTCFCNITAFMKNLINPTSKINLPRPEHPEDIRNVLLVAATLIAAVTFQAGVSPPGGVWQDSKDGHFAGQSIYSSEKKSYYVFLICNTMAFSSSIFLLLCLTYGCPFFLEVLLATFSMSGTYASAIFAVTPHESVKFRFISFAAAVPVLIRMSICLSSWLGKRLRNTEANKV